MAGGDVDDQSIEQDHRRLLEQRSAELGAAGRGIATTRSTAARVLSWRVVIANTVAPVSAALRHLRKRAG